MAALVTNSDESRLNRIAVILLSIRNALVPVTHRFRKPLILNSNRHRPVNLSSGPTVTP